MITGLQSTLPIGEPEPGETHDYRCGECGRRGHNARTCDGHVVRLEVLGTPAPKGSSRAFVNKNTGRAVVAPSGSAANKAKLKSWNVAVREAARDAHAKDNLAERVAVSFADVALDVAIVFRMRRPANHFRTGKHAGELKPTAPHFHTSKPDADKLLRSTLDGLTGTIWDDDSRIAKLAVEKVYADPGHEGASIVVREAITP